VKNTPVAPPPAFISWCEQQLQDLSEGDIDASSLVSLFWEVESETDLKSYAHDLLGSKGDIFKFVREFVDKRKVVVSKHLQSTAAPVTPDLDDFQPSAARKKKGNKFTKVPANMLSFKTEGPPTA
jgi:hypothetical protein